MGGGDNSMMWLYTQPDCPNCEEAKKLLEGQRYQEVPLDNPFVEMGMRTMLRRAIAPVLLKPDMTMWCLGDGASGKQFFRVTG